VSVRQRHASRGAERAAHSSQADGAPAHLRASVQDAMQHLARDAQPVHRAFLIGGAALYAECLALPAGVPGAVERVLLTRVLAPAFDDCDVFMPDFAGSGAWRRAEHAELARWVGGDVPEGVQEENGVEYEFQMWVREQDSRGDA
jgi:dihydrofolate reductase